MPKADLYRIGAIHERSVDGKITASLAARATREPDVLMNTTSLHNVQRVPRTTTGKERHSKLNAISAPRGTNKLHGVIRSAIAIEVAAHPFWTLSPCKLGA